MIVDVEKNVDSNISNSVDFSFSDYAAKLFAMLSNHLYSNKELAVLHELGQNADDAHVMVGKENEPFLVVFPTNLDSNLRIRDYGPGLCEEDVYRLLTKYGESDKQQSNKFRGGWGIGAKSPAAVTDTWRVISHHDGMMKEYLVFVNSHSIPSMKKIREDVTSESGIEVVIPVNPSRFGVWSAAVKTAFKYYKVQPTFKNITVIAQKKTATLSGEGWEFNPSIVCQFVSSCRGYSPDITKINSDLRDAKVKTVLSLPITIYFNNGELRHGINRENIEYTTDVLATIKSRCHSVYDDIQKKFDDIVKSSSNHLDIVVNVTKFVDTIDIHADAAHHFLRSIPGCNTLNIYSRFCIPIGGKFSTHVSVNGSVFDSSTSRFSANTGYVFTSDPVKNEIHVKYNAFGKLKIVLNDGSYGVLSKVRKYTADNPNTYVLILHKDFKYADNSLDPYFIDVKTLPLPVRAKSVRSTVVSDIYTVYGNKFVKINVADVPQREKVVYVEFSNASTLESVKDKRDKLFVANKSHFLKVDVIGVKDKKYAPKGAISVEQFMTELKKELESKPINHFVALRNKHFSRTIFRSWLESLTGCTSKTWVNEKTKLDYNNKLMSDFAHWDQTMIIYVERYFGNGGVKHAAPTSTFDADASVKILTDTYPLLEWFRYETPSSVVVSYVNSVNA